MWPLEMDPENRGLGGLGGSFHFFAVGDRRPARVLADMAPNAVKIWSGRPPPPLYGSVRRAILFIVVNRTHSP